MGHPKVVFLGDNSKTLAADCLASSQSRLLRFPRRNSSREGCLADVRSWHIGRSKVSMWDFSSNEEFAPARHLLLVPSESVVVIWLNISNSQEDTVQDAVRGLNELRQHVCLSSSPGPVRVAFAVWLGRASDSEAQLRRSPDFDRRDCLLSITQQASRVWPRFQESVAIHERLIMVSNSTRSSDELAQFVEQAVAAMKQDHSSSDENKTEKMQLSARLADLKRQQGLPILSWSKYEETMRHLLQRNTMTSDALLKATAGLSVGGKVLLIDKPGILRHVVIDAHGAVSLLGQLLRNTDLQQASLAIGIRYHHLAHAFPKLSDPNLRMLMFQLQELQIAYPDQPATSADELLLKIPSFVRDCRQDAQWRPNQAVQLRTALCLPVMSHSLFPTVQIALARRYGGRSLSMWKSSCFVMRDSENALVVASSSDDKLTLAWTVCGSNQATVSEFLTSLSSVIQTQCAHHIPGVTFQLDNTLDASEFMALASSSAGTQGSSDGMATGRQGEVSEVPVDFGRPFTADGRIQKYPLAAETSSSMEIPPKPSIAGNYNGGAAVAASAAGGQSGNESPADQDDDDDVEPGDSVTLDVFLLDPAFKRELAQELDTQTGGLSRGWERLAEEFDFGNDKIRQWKALLATSPHNGPTVAILNAAHDEERCTVEALGPALSRMGRDDLVKKLEDYKFKYFASLTGPPSQQDNSYEFPAPPPRFDEPAVGSFAPQPEGCPPPYEAMPEATYPPSSIPDDAPSILILYYWEDDNHAKDVKKFCERLRSLNFNAKLDQFEQGRVTRNVLAWKETQYYDAKFVLVICSKNYKKASRGEQGQSPGHPFGSEVQFEYTRLIMSDLTAKGRPVIPILFDGYGGVNYHEVVPISMQVGSCYQWPLKEEDLLYRLQGKEKYVPPKIRDTPLRLEPKVIPGFTHRQAQQSQFYPRPPFPSRQGPLVSRPRMAAPVRPSQPVSFASGRAPIITYPRHTPTNSITTSRPSNLGGMRRLQPQPTPLQTHHH